MNIAERNDDFRRRVLGECQPDGKAVFTRGIADLAQITRLAILLEVIRFKEWDTGNDPYGEHDFGVIELEGTPRVYWKIDYYEDASMEYGTEDKTNCYRVLVIMLADEY